MGVTLRRTLHPLLQAWGETGKIGCNRWTVALHWSPVAQTTADLPVNSHGRLGAASAGRWARVLEEAP